MAAPLAVIRQSQRPMDSRQVHNNAQKFGFGLPETVMPLLPYVKEIWATFQAAPGEKLPATIEEISHEASRSTRTYRVTVVMNQPQRCANSSRNERRVADASEAPSTQPNAWRS